MQTLAAIKVRISINRVHIKSADERSPQVSYSVRPETLEREPHSPRDNNGQGGVDSSFVPQFVFDSDDRSRLPPYYREAKSYPLLKHEEVFELARRFSESGDIAIRNEIVVHNLRLSMSIASHYMGKGLDYDDLVQEGNIGLITAAERFDYAKGFHFSTYATWWVRQGITRALQDYGNQIRIPVHAQERRGKILKVVCELAYELEREPTLEEIAGKSGRDFEEVKMALFHYHIPVISLHEIVGYFEGGNPIELGESEEMPTEQVAIPLPSTTLEAKEALEEACARIRELLVILNVLPRSGRDKLIFKRYYGLDGEREGHTLESVAASLGGITRGRVQQIISVMWEELHEYGVTFDDASLMAEFERIHRLEDLAGVETAITSADGLATVGDFLSDEQIAQLALA
jgi:RNA polymerase primary sigma factor